MILGLQEKIFSRLMDNSRMENISTYLTSTQPNTDTFTLLRDTIGSQSFSKFFTIFKAAFGLEINGLTRVCCVMTLTENNQFFDAN